MEEKRKLRTYIMSSQNPFMIQYYRHPGKVIRLDTDNTPSEDDTHKTPSEDPISKTKLDECLVDANRMFPKPHPPGALLSSSYVRALQARGQGPKALRTWALPASYTLHARGQGPKALWTSRALLWPFGPLGQAITVSQGPLGWEPSSLIDLQT